MFVYSTAGDAAKAARVLAQVSVGYYFIITACRQLNADAESETEIAVDNGMDLLLQYHTLMLAFDFLFEDGYWRPAASRTKMVQTHGMHFLLNIAANTDLALLDEYTVDFIPDNFRMRFIRLLRVPYTLANMIGIEELTVPIIKAAFYQCLLLAACSLVCLDSTYQLIGLDRPDFDVSPQLIVSGYWLLLTVRCIFRRKAAAKGPKKDEKSKEEDDQADDKDLDIVCQVR
jgi:hypothetical protein